MPFGGKAGLAVVFLIRLVNVMSVGLVVVVVIVSVGTRIVVVFEPLRAVLVMAIEPLTMVEFVGVMIGVLLVTFESVNLVPAVDFVYVFTGIVVVFARLRVVLVRAIEPLTMVEFEVIMIGVLLVEVGFVVFVVSDEIVVKVFLVVAFSVIVT